jgi:hypothetical protein
MGAHSHVDLSAGPVAAPVIPADSARRSTQGRAQKIGAGNAGADLYRSRPVSV